MPVCDNSLKIFLRVICVCYNSVTEQLLFPTTDKATNPSNRQEDWEYIIGFCDQINKELEGPQISVRLLAHKIQSPQEWEALQALTVLEACMKNCGRRFHNEVGKFRFLNELIKVVSPKYLGDRVSEKVKVKVIELLYSWSVALPDEAKIKEAYQMLKRQGIVTIDPDVPVDKTLIPSPPARPKNPVFENEEKSKRLAELLKSKKPEDLQEANRLIKNMVKEDEARMQKVTKRTCTLEEASNSVKLLNEMLSHFNREESTQADRERDVFKLATETEDNDNSLGDILQASDDLSRVINSYKKIVEGQTINGDTPGSSAPSGAVAADLLMPSPLPCSLPTRLKQLSGQGSYSVSSGDNACLNLGQTSTSLSLLDEELLSLGNTHSSQPSHSSEHESEMFRKCSFVCGSAGKICPVTAYDKTGVRVLLHFATECPPGRSDVLVIVVSMLNTAPLPVRNVVLQAAVPKSMKVKLQPPSGADLPPFNPILPPGSITQVMLLANPLKEKVRLRYKLTFTLGEQLCTEVGEVDQFPPAEKWGCL
uniref:Golgi associated, gamma adaptin ear containing, ARF binding protein 3a n=1 Tax=Denticeps clupeoides TaxID=299321 RepID=A0AAY4CPG7_9TELE